MPFPSPDDDARARCRGCGHPLGGLVEPICPECGERFGFFAPSTWTTLEDEATKATRDRHPPNRLMIIVSVVLAAWIVVASSGIAGPGFFSVMILMLACPALMVIWFLRGLVAAVSTAFRFRSPFAHGFSRREAAAWLAVPGALAAGAVLAWSGLPKTWRWRYIDGPVFRAEAERLLAEPLLTLFWDARRVGTVEVDSVVREPGRLEFHMGYGAFMSFDMLSIVYTPPGVSAPKGERLDEDFTLVRISW